MAFTLPFTLSRLPLTRHYPPATPSLQLGALGRLQAVEAGVLLETKVPVHIAERRRQKEEGGGGDGDVGNA